MTLTITHTHEAGTLIEGTERGDGTADILKANGWRWGRSIASWFIPQSRDKSAKSWKIDATRSALEAAGFDVVTEIDNERRRSAAEIEADKMERLGARVEALDAKSERATAADDAAYAKALGALSRLPEGGEPIHVGHHSESRHRNAIAKADTAMRRSVEAGEYAREIERRAQVAAASTEARYAPLAVARRIERIKTDIRGYERRISGSSHTFAGGYVETTSAATGDYAVRLTAELEGMRDDLAFWEGIRAAQVASGATTDYSRETVAKGDKVRFWGGWALVTRTNAKSVSVEWDNGNGYTRRGTVLYHEIKAHAPATALVDA